MAYELVCSKIYTPYLGSSVYVWTSILTVTLLGLALGYRAGDKIKAEKEKSRLFLALLVSAIFIGVSIFIASLILPSLLNIDIRIASLLSGIILLLIPMFMLGTVSPLIVKQMSANHSSVGSNSGLIYGISTIGGVLISMIAVFTLIPNIGVQVTIFLIAGILCFAALLSKFIGS